MDKSLKKILYVSPNSIFDQSNGASISMRTLLKGLADRGHTVRALNCTVFDHPDGGNLLKSMINKPLKDGKGFIVRHGDNYVTTLRTAQPSRKKMLPTEEMFFFTAYCRALEDLKPDIVITWGGGVLDLLVMAEAKRRGIPVAFYLVSTSYVGELWKRDVNYFITDSEATSRHYRETQDVDVTPIGKFLDPDDYVSAQRDPKYFTFINPLAVKGASTFAKIALVAKTEIPDARFLVVESRGKWQTAVKAMGLSASDFTNVDMAPIQDSMLGVYAVTKTLLVPSYWSDSGPRVIGEALMNGIPVLGSTQGGIREHIGKGGHCYDIPQNIRDAKGTLPTDETVRPWIDELKRHHSDERYYQTLSAAALEESEKYNLDRALDKLIAVLDGG